MVCSTCPFCKNTYKNIHEHLLKRHQSCFTTEVLSNYDLKKCRCGRVVKSLPHHARYCKLALDVESSNASTPVTTFIQPETIQNNKTLSFTASSLSKNSFSSLTEDDLTTTETIETEDGRFLLSEFKFLLDVLQEEQPSSLALSNSLIFLARLPRKDTSLNLTETKIFSKTFNTLCNDYNQSPTAIKLLKILCLPKLVANAIVTKNKISHFRKNATSFPNNLDASTLHASFNASFSSKNTDLKTKVNHLLKLRKIKRASRALSDDDSQIQLDFSPELRQQLMEKHPFEQLSTWKNLPISNLNFSLDFVKIICNQFSTDTAGGISGFDGTLLKTIKHLDSFKKFLQLLMMDISKGTQLFKEALTTSRLIVLKKPSGGLRPIAIGEIFYRIAVKGILRMLPNSLLFNQLGCGSIGGVEPLIHHARKQISDGLKVFTFDLKNAFNSVSRNFLMKELKQRCKLLCRTFNWSYGSAAKLFLGDGSFLHSTSGVRQGDPLGPLLFSIALSPIIQKLEQALPEDEVFTYLDDLVIFSKTSDETMLIKKVQDVFNSFETSSHLKLCSEKTKIFSSSNEDQFLGSTLSQNETLFNKHLDDFNLKLKKLKLLHHQDAFYLLRTCVLPQLNFFLRTTPVDAEQCQKLHSSISSFIQFLTSKFSFTKFNSDLLHLPIRNGGLGLMSPLLISQHGFQASKELSKWQMESENFHSDLDVIKQSSRLKDAYKQIMNNLFDSFNDFEKLCFAENSTEIGSKWLHALPVEASTRILNPDFCASICSRLLLSPSCRNGCSEDRINHFEQCSCFSQVKVSRHEDIKKCLADFFKETNCVVSLEPFNKNNNRRADLLVSTTQGKTAFDVSVVSLTSKKNFRTLDSLREALASLRLNNDSRESSILLRLAENVLRKRVASKTRENTGLDFGGQFQPFVLSTGGVVSKESLEHVIRQGKKDPGELLRLKYRLSVSLTVHRRWAFKLCARGC
eukprot:snap_masked-scaffold_97-processed-gene-0.3-mRNA-1 protein AED:1.00 eAED:1.00 QI:0/-1/0/0/-1/1/1/0/968